MNLAQLFTQENVMPALASTEHMEVIEEMVRHLQQGGLLSGITTEEAIAVLLEREERTSTGIGSGVAIPHAFSENLNEVVAVFARSEAGVDFDAIDNSPVEFIVLFLVPKDQYHMHLKTLAALAKFFNDSETRDALREAKDKEEILQVFAKLADQEQRELAVEGDEPSGK